MLAGCRPPIRSAKWFLSILIFAALCACSGGSSGDPPGFVEFEGGRLYRVGNVPVLQLHGTHYQMGRQYGMLLQAELNASYDLLIATFSPFFSYDRMRQIANNVYDRSPQQQKEILIGMAETSGLGLEKQIILNALEWIPKIDAFVPHCSGFGVWGDYTQDRKLVFGRNNDDTATIYGNFGAYVVVAVFNPTDSGIGVALVNYAGVVYAATGINRSGIFMELNSGNWQGYNVNHPLLLATLFSFLESCATQSQVNTAFSSVLPDIASIVNVADPAIAYSFEAPLVVTPPLPNVIRRGPDDDGMIAATNHFVDPAWGLAPPVPDSANAFTALRRSNLLAFAAANKGSFNVAKVASAATPKWN